MIKTLGILIPKDFFKHLHEKMNTASLNRESFLINCLYCFMIPQLTIRRKEPFLWQQTYLFNN